MSANGGTVTPNPTIPKKTEGEGAEEGKDGESLLTGGGSKLGPDGKPITKFDRGVYTAGDPLEELQLAVSKNRQKMNDQIDVQKEVTKSNAKLAGRMKTLEVKADKEMLEAQQKAKDAEGGGFWRKLRSAFTGEIQRAQAAAKKAQSQAEFTRAAVAETSAKQQKAAHTQEFVGSKIKQAIGEQKKNKDRHGDIVKSVESVREVQAAALGGKISKGE